LFLKVKFADMNKEYKICNYENFCTFVAPWIGVKYEINVVYIDQFFITFCSVAILI